MLDKITKGSLTTRRKGALGKKIDQSHHLLALGEKAKIARVNKKNVGNNFNSEFVKLQIFGIPATIT